ncbi:MAG: class I SAM-dependent methyltransferase [Myxococcota bacterium]|nr:class I SAM-dependent methyltransferase [Myxococcota bacterium]MEC8381054.1 class I SAM-dependent methyltransferase [Myxococcota bacterium]
MPFAFGFDGHAKRYSSHWSADPVVQRMRSQVHQTVSKFVPIGSHILDVGCGAGCDLAWLMLNGYKVTAIDQSLGMVTEARARTPTATVLLGSAEDLPVDQIQTPVDAVLLNFGVVNAISPTAFIQSVQPLVKPETVMIVVAMPRFHMAWMLRQFLRGRWSAALHRCRPAVDIDVHGEMVRTRYWNRSDLKEMWPTWTCLSMAGLGMIFPPQSAFGSINLGTFEQRLGRIPMINQWGDHTLTVWRQI